MRTMFKRTLLARCKGDWCVRALLSQFLVNHRKYMKKNKTSGESFIENLPAFSEIDAQYRREQGENGSAADVNEDDDEDVDEDEAAADVGFRGVEGAIPYSDDDDDDDQEEPRPEEAEDDEDA
jgi:hypothetical protein